MFRAQQGSRSRRVRPSPSTGNSRATAHRSRRDRRPPAAAAAAAARRRPPPPPPPPPPVDAAAPCGPRRVGRQGRPVARQGRDTSYLVGGAEFRCESPVNADGHVPT